MNEEHKDFSQGFGIFIFKIMMLVSGLMFLCLGVSTASATEMSSESNIFKLGEVVVSADRETKETPSTIVVITAEDIERTHANNLGEALRTIPGLLFRQTRTKNEYYVSMRGFDQESVLILLDGVPIYEPYEGLVNLNHIPVQNIAEIKVIKGNASAIYGANTMGGVINVITKKGTSKPTFSANYQVSDYNTHHIQATHGWKVGDFSYFISASHKESDGYKLAKKFKLPKDVTDSMAAAPTNPASPKNTPIKPDDGRRENSDYERQAFTFTGTYDFTPNHKLGFGFEYYGNEYGVPPVPIYREHRTGFYYYPRYWRFTKWDRYTFSLVEESQLSEHWRVKGRLFYDIYESGLDAYDDDTYSTMNRIGGPPSGKSSYDDYSKGGLLHVFWSGIPRNNIRFGLTFKEDVHREKFGIAPTERLSSYTYSVGLEDEIHVKENFTLTVGCSYDALEKRERNQASSPNGKTGDNLNTLNPLIGFSYDYSPALNIYGSVARKVRFPTMRNLYASGVIGPKGNPDLNEQRSINYELGSRFAFASNFILESAIFYSDVKDMISFNNQIGRFEQYEKAYIAGFELGLSSQLTAQLYAKISYTYLRARADSRISLEKELPAFNGAPLVYRPKELPYRPEHKIDLELRQKFDFGTTVDLNGSYVSEKTYYNHADAPNRQLIAKKERLDGYFLFNLKVSQDIGYCFQAYVAVDNLFNENYQDIFQLPAAGRTIWAGLKFDL